MRELFADLPEAVDNTIEIARRCAYRPRSASRSCRPSSPTTRATSARGETEAAELSRQAEAGLEERIAAARRRRRATTRRGLRRSASPSSSTSSPA